MARNKQTDLALADGATTFPFCEVLAACFIAAQIFGIVVGRVSTHESFWSWTPHDRTLEYEIDVHVGGRLLEQKEVRRRYGGLPESGLRFDYVEDVTAIIKTYQRRHPEDGAQVRVQYRINGGEVGTWFWPERQTP